MDAKLGDIVLRAWDALIVLTDSDFARRWQNRRVIGVVGLVPLFY